MKSETWINGFLFLFWTDTVWYMLELAGWLKLGLVFTVDI